MTLSDPADIWFKSSTSEVDNCVEVSFGDRVRVRDSKNSEGPVLSMNSPGWRSFVSFIASCPMTCMVAAHPVSDGSSQSFKPSHSLVSQNDSQPPRMPQDSPLRFDAHPRSLYPSE
ncbi:DUF397 domain-containing protein [Streptomyces griseiscabiei]|uniref:DUF397 domain-containing protein n=1 Tax=Streptomyces griseiscabiei TaxID=2993540 RepID=UPI000A3C4DC1|nr:DUF397 domain-containing protein [Streptomyces griseiscabiei]MBZ3901609.1 DUF397 domain-containing protein [Streptomyces griseiscabiei]